MFVPKVGRVKFRQSRDVDGTIKNATVTWRAGRWSISFQTEIEVPDPVVHPFRSEVGIDRGVVHLAVIR